MKKNLDLRKVINTLDHLKQGRTVTNFSEMLKNILEFEKEFVRPKTFDDIGKLILQVEDIVNRQFQSVLENFDENFKRAFEESRYEYIRGFEEIINKNEKLNEKQKKELIFLRRNKIREFLMLKNKLIRQLLKGLLKKGYFNEILIEEDINDLIILIDSEFFDIFDGLFINWERSLQENGDLQLDDNVYYGGFERDKVVSYREFIGTKVLDRIRNKISTLNNENLRNYILGFLDLIKKGRFDYNVFVELEKYEIQGWKNEKKSKIRFVVPMENYFHPNLIEPEFEIHLSSPVQGKELEEIMEFSKRYFNSSFGMDKISFNFTEILIPGGRTSFVRVLGRSFPNDKDLSIKYGKIIYMIKSRNLKTIERADNYLTQLGLKLNREIFKNIVFDEVKYHEYGHSLFLENKYDSLLEELKATLFYFLYIYDNLNNLNEELIKNLIYFVIYDFIKRLPNKGSKSNIKYWIMNGHILKVLAESGLVSLTNNTLQVDINFEKFRKFLERLKEDLFTIKRIYELDNIESKKKEENKFLEGLDDFLKDWENFFRRNIKF